jgi:hypothetical protein
MALTELGKALFGAISWDSNTGIILRNLLLNGSTYQNALLSLREKSFLFLKMALHNQRMVQNQYFSSSAITDFDKKIDPFAKGSYFISD